MPNEKKWVVIDKGNGLIVGLCDGVIDQGDSGGPELSLTSPILIDKVDVPVPGLQGFNVECRTRALPPIPWRKPFDEAVCIVVPLRGVQWYSWVTTEEVESLRTKMLPRDGAG